MREIAVSPMRASSGRPGWIAILPHESDNSFDSDVYIQSRSAFATMAAERGRLVYRERESYLLRKLIQRFGDSFIRSREDAAIFSRASGCLLLMVLVAYWPMTSAGYIWDDPAYVIDNVELRSLSGLWRIWFVPSATPQYYPLVFTTFWVEYHLWGLRPLGFHVVNIVLHAVNAILLYRILVTLRLSGAFFAAAVFAVHPVHVESVAWITERKNVLSGLFYLLAFQAYWRFATSQILTTESPHKGRWWSYSLALVSYVCALLSKSVTASLPAAILVVWWWRNGRIGWRQVLPLVPFFVVGVVAGLHTAQVELNHVGAEGADWNWSTWERCLIAGRAVWFYLGKLVWPHPLIFIYPKWKIDSTSIWQALYPLSAVGLLVCLWAGRHRWGRGPLAAALLFGGTLVPALGFVNVYPMRFSFVADHFQYLASIAAISFCVASITVFLQWSKRLGHYTTMIMSLVVLVLGSIAFVRCDDYRGREEIWSATIADNPDCWLAPLHLAALRLEQQKFREALSLFEIVLSLKAKEPYEPAEMADLHAGMADCCTRLGDTSSAQKHTRASLAFFEQLQNDRFQDPAAVRYNIAISHQKLGEFELAATEFRRLLEIDPENATANHELGSLLVGLNQIEEAASRFEASLRKDPKNPLVHYKLALVYWKLGKLSFAQDHLAITLQLNPNFHQARQLLDQISVGAPQ